jgi:flavin-dependent dehydrogenase
MRDSYDVVIVGGGPGGSSTGSLLKTYNPALTVCILEKATFPREHVGESLLPTIGKILAEFGAWDAVEAAGFPIKIGATYKWGTTDDLWDFNLLDTREIEPDAPRPGKYEGWRVRSAFQVDRARFDDILLKRAADLGCEVFEASPVIRVETEGDQVISVELEDGRRVCGRTFIDASGNAAVIRKALKIPVEEPPSLRNIAIWDHWDNAEWAVSIGRGGTRVQVTSLGFGWIWVIPISPTRTSIGLICPAEYYKNCGKRPEELYAESVRKDPRIAALLKNAVQANAVKATRDWSFLADRMGGENWFLVGESAGFADPILAAGITMTMVGAKECAYTILELARSGEFRQWLLDNYNQRQVQRIRQHIRFANFWYSANAHFTDLMDYTAEIAKDAGFNVDAKSAWQWLGTGGFVSLETAGAGLAGHSLEHIRNLEEMMFHQESEWQITRYNLFRLNLEGASLERIPIYQEGRIFPGKVYRREGLELPLTGGFRLAVEMLQKESTLAGMIGFLRQMSAKFGPIIALGGLEALESMVRDGWVDGSYDATEPLLSAKDIPRTTNIDWNKDATDPFVKTAATRA